MISDEYKCIFLHANKCGGKSIEKTVWGVPVTRGSADHRFPMDYIEQYGMDTWNDYFTFGFARNPWARAVSIYHGRKQIRQMKLPSFDKWIREETAVPHPIGNLRRKDNKIGIRTQSAWFYYNDKPLDFIGRVETYAQDFEKVKQTVGLPAEMELAHANASSHDHYSTYYNADTRDMVHEYFRNDVERFGYSFEEPKS